MATAKLELPDGTKVNIEGTAEEVASLLDKLSGRSSSNASEQLHKKPQSRSPKARIKDRPLRKGPKILVEELEGENFFKTKRTIGEVQKKLEEKGHIYPLTHISTPLLRLTRARVLRRIKEKDGWVYVS